MWRHTDIGHLFSAKIITLILSPCVTEPALKSYCTDSTKKQHEWCCEAVVANVKKKKKKNGDDLLFLSLAVCVESYRGKEINGIS